MYKQRPKEKVILDARPDTNRRQMVVEVEVDMKGGVKERRTFTVKVRNVKLQLGIKNPRKTPDKMVGRAMVIPEIQNQLHRAGYSVPPVRVGERCY